MNMNTVAIYDVICELCHKFFSKQGSREVLNVFDKYLPECKGISEVKEIDFMP